MRYFFFLLFLISFNSTAQLYVGPLRFDPSRSSQPERSSNMKIAAVLDTLPFFDDFGYYSGNPDAVRWESSGGVYINDNYGYLPPSLGVATFDGMDANGRPYSAFDLFAKGASDTLTSLSINLSSYSPADSVVFSFFWQGAGMGAIPDRTQGDSLALAFQDSSGIWRAIWKETGDSTEFRQVLIKLDSAYFFHDQFAFRFISYGQKSGSYDVWNLDYILLDKNRTTTYKYYPDQAMVERPGSILKNYQAMPWKQFFANPLEELKDTLFIPFKNLNFGDELVNSTNDTSYVRDLITGDTLFHFNPSGYIVKRDTMYNFHWKIAKESFLNLNKPLLVESNLLYKTGDSPPYNRNESAAGVTALTDYFAHDDGSAEAVFGNNDNTGAMAVKFTASQPDSLIGVDIAFVREGKDQTGTEIEIVAWSSITPWEHFETEVAVSDKKVWYQNMGGFTRYFFDSPVYLNGTFYVGFRQFIREYIMTGFDLNIQTPDSIYYRLDGVWNEYLYYPGSIMIRPVFGTAEDIVTSVPKENKALDCSVFPNPTSGLITIEGKVTNVSVYDLSGRLLIEESLGYSDKEVDLSSLPQGIYMVHLRSGEYSAVKRVIKSR